MRSPAAVRACSPPTTPPFAGLLVGLLSLAAGFGPPSLSTAVGAGVGATDQTRALAEVKKLGGKYEVDAKAPGRPVVKVDLTRTKADDKALAVIVKGLPGLQTLELESTQVTDAGLAHLEGLTHLKELTLVNTEVTDAGLARLKGLTRLSRLDLSATKVTDAGLAHLKGLTDLRDLGLGLTKITDQGLVRLKGLTHLRKLDLLLTKVTDDGVRELRKALPRVEVAR